METKNNLIPHIATHPGSVLREELKERDIKQKDFAAQIGMAPEHLSELICGKRNISKKVALKLEEALGISYSFWINMQNGYDYNVIQIARREQARQVRKDSIPTPNQSVVQVAIV